MKTKFKAFKIDSKAKTVTEIEVSGLDDMQAVVGGLIEQAHAFDNGDSIFVNEEGLLNDEADEFFLFKGAHQPFAGNGLVIGCDLETGDSASVKSAFSEIASQVQFMNRAEILEYVKTNDC